MSYNGVSHIILAQGRQGIPTLVGSDTDDQLRGAWKNYCIETVVT
jgi:hypothetical protein